MTENMLNLYQNNEELTSEQIKCKNMIDLIYSNRHISNEKKLQKSLLILLDFMRAKKGLIYILDDKRNKLKIAAADNENLIGKEKELNEESISIYVIKNKKPLLVKDISKDKRIKLNKYKGLKCSILSVPLFNESNKIFGIFCAYSKLKDLHFTEKDIELINCLSSKFVYMIECLNSDETKDFNKYQDILKEILYGKNDLYEDETNELIFITEPNGEQKDKKNSTNNYNKKIKNNKYKKINKKNRIKSSYYINKDKFELLNKTLEETKHLKLGKKTRITKSLLINISLEHLMNDFMKLKEYSILGKKLNNK